VDGKEVFPHEVASISDKPLLKGKSVDIQIGTGSSAQIITGTTILDVTIANNKASLVVTDGGSAYTVPIDKINFVMEAINCVGKSINFSSINGVIDSVVISNGVTYLVSGDRREAYEDYLESIKK
jgi:hypothetical protein